MKSYEARLKDLVLKLHDVGALKFGDFKMKIGINSPVYFDLRVIVSYPEVMESLSLMLHEFAEPDMTCDHICGVPYTALPIATIISVHAKKPMLLRRKEGKGYGTRKMIEGVFKSGDTCIIIEDVVTTGSSIVDTVRDLEKVGLKVTTAVVTVDREQGGTKNLAEKGIQMKSLLTLSQILDILCAAGKIDATAVLNVRKYIEASQINIDGSFQLPMKTRINMPFTERSQVALNSVASKLLQLMAEKQTNLCVAADLSTCEEVLQLAVDVGPHICLFKTHVDIIQDFSEEFVKNLQSIAEEYKFLIMEDRKFSDIGYLVEQQYMGGIYSIASWADLVTAHPVPGCGVVTGLEAALKKGPQNISRGCFLVAEMSSEGNLNSSNYIQGAMKIASNYENFVTGIVCQSSRVVTSPGLIQLTPGVMLQSGLKSDGLGQQYNSPEYVIIERGADIAVVGRGITKADDRSKQAMLYREALWNAYKKRIHV